MRHLYIVTSLYTRLQACASERSRSLLRSRSSAISLKRSDASATWRGRCGEIWVQRGGKDGRSFVGVQRLLWGGGGGDLIKVTAPRSRRSPRVGRSRAPTAWAAARVAGPVGLEGPARRPPPARQHAGLGVWSDGGVFRSTDGVNSVLRRVDFHPGVPLAAAEQRLRRPLPSALCPAHRGESRNARVVAHNAGGAAQRACVSLN